MKPPAKHTAALLLLLFLLVSTGLWFNPFPTRIPAAKNSEHKPGGDITVGIKPYPSFMLPAHNLAQEKLPDFHAGKALAHQPWVNAPTITDARDGLGPLYNARTCLLCHVNGGRGEIPNDPERYLVSGIVRLSLPGFDPVAGVVPEPVYGDQLQSQSNALSHLFRGQSGAVANAMNEVTPEALIYIRWHESNFIYPDGQNITLRQPQFDLRELGYGEIHKDTLTSLRTAPPIHGVGLLEMIAQRDIEQHADTDDKNNDGISGRVNIVWDFETGHSRPGRFGWKANKASVRLQVAAALQGDMGISNPVFPHQPCTVKQIRCHSSIHGNDKNGLEISDDLLSLLVNFNMSLGVPERRKPNHPMVMQGRDLFYQTGCQGCHHPSYVTQKSHAFPHLSQQEIWPYTDLLLHDLGEALADYRPDYLASGSEWRTAPLWGVGLSHGVNGSKQYLHDGRARSIEEAILWHGGEAESVKARFVSMEKDKRRALMAFVKSL